MVGDVCGLSFGLVFLCQFKNRRLGQSVVRLFVNVSLLFVCHFGVSAWYLKCTKHVCCNSDVVQ